MILVHEFGHYSAGKILHFKINEFSIGFGKAIFSKTKKNGEKFSLRIFPLGGYCAFEGEDEEKSNSPDAFNNQKPWKRLIVLFMGAFFNFLSAVIFAIIFLMAFGYQDKVQVTSVNVPIGYESNWLQKGDIIYAVNGKHTNFVYDEYFTTLIANYDEGENFNVSVLRDGKTIELEIFKSWFNCPSKVDNDTTRRLYALNDLDYSYAVKYESGLYKFYEINNPEKTYTVDFDGHVVIGGAKFFVNIDEVSNIDEITISYSKVGINTQNYRYGFFEAIGQSFVFCFGWAWKILLILFQLISGKILLTSMGGTVTTVVTIAQVTQNNIASLLLLIPIISINLAVFNLLPFPALDGARMVFVLIEMIRRKPINRKIEGTIHFIGLIVLLAFVLLVDILHFVL